VGPILKKSLVMYSWELDSLFKNNEYTFSNFYNFVCKIDGSPQLKYNLLKNLKDRIVLRVWTEDGYDWNINILK
jgi:hypothetical protein